MHPCLSNKKKMREGEGGGKYVKREEKVECGESEVWVEVSGQFLHREVKIFSQRNALIGHYIFITK